MQIISWICLVLLMLGVGNEATAATPPAKIIIGFAAINARVIPLWAAKEEGFFAKNGVDAELVFIRGAPTLNAALLSGDIQAGYTGGTAVMGPSIVPATGA